MANNNRFVKAYTQGSVFSNMMEVWVDRQTGVNYLYSCTGSAAGLTVLLNRDGTPVVSTLPIECED